MIAEGKAMGLNRLIPNTVESVDSMNEPCRQAGEIEVQSGIYTFPRDLMGHIIENRSFHLSALFPVRCVRTGNVLVILEDPLFEVLRVNVIRPLRD